MSFYLPIYHCALLIISETLKVLHNVIVWKDATVFPIALPFDTMDFNPSKNFFLFFDALLLDRQQVHSSER